MSAIQYDSGGHMTHEVIEGTVDSVNERGIRINGEWLNFSKFKAVAAPRQGEHVQVGIDTKGFILDITHVDGAQTPAVSSSDRDRRLAVLAVAAQFLGQLAHSRDDVRSDHVLVLADKWLAWIEDQ